MTKTKTSAKSSKKKTTSSAKKPKKAAVQYVATPSVVFDTQITDAVTQSSSIWQTIKGWFKGL